MNIGWNGSPNFSSREGFRVIAIVDHITQGSTPGCIDWLCNPASQASAHYVVSKAGVITQLVHDADKAWHAGVVKAPSWSLYHGNNPNLYTIGIEHEGLSGDNLTALQYQATLWLHRDLMKKFGIPADTEHIIGHYRINSVDKAGCPGLGFPWVRLMKDLVEGDALLMSTPVTPVTPMVWNGDGYHRAGPVAADDVWLSVRVPGSKVVEVTGQVNALGYACRRLELA